MSTEQTNFSLDRFEYLAFTRDREAAARELMKLLHGLDSRYGGVDITAKLYASNAPDQTFHMLTRIASALSCFFSDPELNFSPQGFNQMISWQRWLSSLFAASPFGNADHILRALNVKGMDEALELTEPNFVKFCLLFTPDSEIPVDVDGLWAFNKELAAALFFVLLSPRFLGTVSAHQKREILLKWLPARLPEIDHLERLPLGIIHDVYMHCSYADLPSKHDIKKPINALIRKTLHKECIPDLDFSNRTANAGKPIMLVVLEYFSENHSIYRTHSEMIRAARNNFHLIGVAMPDMVDAAGCAVFDEFLELRGDLLTALRQLRVLAADRNADVLYMPSVGMFQLTMFLANLRIAPLQLMGLGHPATSHSSFIDYVVVEEDYVGDPACFSEKLLTLPKDGMPYVPSAGSSRIAPILREHPDIIKIAVCATTMKLNPQFLWACASIALKAKRPVEFHFLVGFAQGLIGFHVEQILKQYLGSHVVMHQHQPYPQYMEVIRGCDLFINPFPFGNTNGIVDTVTAGLVGICRTGPEVHEHIDEGLFRRLGLPDWMITKTTEEYVDAAIRLIDHDEERLDLRRELIDQDSLQRLFTGRPELFGERVRALVNDELVVFADG